MIPELQILAREVLNVLKLQQTYFRTRTPSHLQISKDAERRLAEKCKTILNPPQAGLFDGEATTERQP